MSSTLTMTLEDGVAPQPPHQIQAQPKDQEFCFVLVEKSAGADRKESLRKIRSHVLKQFRRKQKLANELQSTKPRKLPMVPSPFVFQQMPPPVDALPIPAQKYRHLRSYTRDLVSKNGAGKVLCPLFAEDPLLSHAFAFYVQCGLDAVRFLPSSAHAFAIKTVVLQKFHERLLSNNSNTNLLTMMLLLAGSSLLDKSQGPELETHVIAIHRLVHNCNGLASLNSTFHARIISLHVMTLHADFSAFPHHGLLSPQDCLRADLDDMNLPLHQGTPLGWPADSLWYQFCQNIISYPTSASTGMIYRQRALQKLILSEVNRELSNPDTTHVSRCYQLTVRILVCMAISGVAYCEDLVHVAGEDNSTRQVIRESISQLVYWFQKTDIHNLWNDQGGLLYWLTNVICPLSRGLPEVRFFKALQLRFMIDLSCTQRSWHPVLAPIAFFLDYQSACSTKFWTQVLENPIN